MQITTLQKRAIDHYYRELAAYHEKKVTHETAVRSAFQNLLAAFAQSANWVLIPEQTLANGKRPDGTLRDSFNLPRGYWEAKDTRDDLHTEIRKKISVGYPITNTIFEDTRRAMLYQNGRLALEADLTQPKALTPQSLTSSSTTPLPILPALNEPWRILRRAFPTWRRDC